MATHFCDTVRVIVVYAKNILATLAVLMCAILSWQLFKYFTKVDCTMHFSLFFF